MTFKPLLFIAIGFGLKYLSGQIELRGDMAPVVPGGVSSERLYYHLIALVLLVGAIGFFIAALVSLFRGRRA